MTGKRLLGVVLDDLVPRAARRRRLDGRADRQARRHVRVRDRDRRRLHRPAALLLRRDVEARGRDGVQADELAGQGGRRRCRRDARGVGRASRSISRDGKTYTFTIKPGFRFSNGQPVTARSFVDAFNRFANPRMQSTGVAFLDIVQGAQAVIDGKAQHDLGRPGAGQQARRAPDEGVAGLPRPPDDAVHAGDRPQPRRPDRRERDQPVRVVRPVLLLEPDAGPLDHAQAQPELQGRPRGERRHDPGERRQRHRRPVSRTSSRARPTTRRPASRRPSGRTSSRSTGSTRRTAACRCGRSSTSATSR